MAETCCFTAGVTANCAPGHRGVSLWAPRPARALAQAIAIAFAALIFPEAFAEPTGSQRHFRSAPVLSPDRPPSSSRQCAVPKPYGLLPLAPHIPNSGESRSPRTEPFGLMALSSQIEPDGAEPNAYGIRRPRTSFACAGPVPASNSKARPAAQRRLPAS